MFFSFLAVFPLPESYQNDPKFHFNTLLRSDTQKSSKNVENTTVFWSRCETVFGVWSRCETVFGPPPAKADIATAILTNVIEHLVLLLPPNKHAFTAKAVWADLSFIATTTSVPLKKFLGGTQGRARARTQWNNVSTCGYWLNKKLPSKNLPFFLPAAFLAAAATAAYMFYLHLDFRLATTRLETRVKGQRGFLQHPKHG